MSEAISDVKEAAERLSEGWQKYVNAFGEPPHGTVRQMAGLLSFAGLFPVDSDEPDLAHVKDMRHLAIYGAASLARFSNWDGVSPELSRAMCSAAIAIRDKAKALGIQPTSKETTT